MDNIAIKIEDLSKVYKLYDKHSDRLKEALGLTRKKIYHEHYALKDINLEIKKGETLGIVGTNGSGKSTLLKLITGVLNQTQGNIVVNGSVSALLELGTGFNPEYTGKQNIYLYGTMFGKTKEEVDKDIDSIIEFADIDEFIDQPVKTYSSGMFARLAFSVAINVEPDILIVDEILSVGDLRFQIKCMDKMREMMLGGTTILFVNHDINAIKRFCSRVIWLDNGQMVECGEVDIITDKYLDFLRMEDYRKTKEKCTEQKDQEVSIENTSKNADVNKHIAKITSFKILDKNNLSIEKAAPNEKVIIEVTYEVYDDSIDDAVIGIAIHTLDQVYLCGLNTLLGSVTIPWEKGENKFYLEYTMGILAVGGTYQFDVAIFEQTATVPIHYIAKVNQIIISSSYLGEGVYLPPHQWKDVAYE